MALTYPDIDPVLIQLGPLAIRWYSLAYIGGLLLGWALIRNLNRRGPTWLSDERIEDLLGWMLFGVVLGGRLGYVIFYQPGYYFNHPIDILKVWEGGMSFHGGLLGVITALWGFTRRHRVPFWPVMDQIAVATPIGLFFGRLANFINGELFGRVADVPWAMVFPNGGPIPRHPSQLYEAGLEGAALFLLLWLLATHTSIREKPGMLSGLFLIGYGSARAFCELFRQPDVQLGFLWGPLTMGHLLSLPMIALGIGLMLYFRRRQAPILPESTATANS